MHTSSLTGCSTEGLCVCVGGREGGGRGGHERQHQGLVNSQRAPTGACTDATRL